MERNRGGKGKGRKLVAGLEFHRGKWRWRPRVEGKRLTIPLVAMTEEEAAAEALALKRLGQLEESATWEAAVTRYLSSGLSKNTRDSRGPVLRAIGREVKLVSARSLTPAVAMRWWMLTLDRGDITRGTAAHYLRDLRAFTKWARSRGMISWDPLEGIEVPAKEERTRDVFLPWEKVAELLAAARAEGRRDYEWILALGCECAMRRSEMSACRPGWFDLKQGTVTIPISDGDWKRKGREGRRRAATVALSEVVLEIIAHHGLTEPYLIAPQKTTWGKHRYRFEFRRGFSQFMARHGCGHVTIHDLRRSFGSNRVSAGLSMEKVANWMGIDPATAWKHYARFVPGDAEINRGAAKAPAAPAAATVPAVTDDVAARLGKVEALFAAGVITAEERAGKRAEILRDL